MIQCSILSAMYLRYVLVWQPVDQLQKSKQRLNRILAENTGKTIEEIRRDTERDNFMTAAEALQYGLIDRVIEER